MAFTPATPLPSSKAAKRLSFESTGSPLFSPSAAARYAEQAEQWNHVDKWLSRAFYPNRVPDFERNEETLKWLYDLSILSMQRTKEKKALVAAQKRMAEEYMKEANRIDEALKKCGLDLDSMDEETKAAVDEIVDMGLTLNVDPLTATTFDIAKAMSDRVDEDFQAEQEQQELQFLNESLEALLAELNDLNARIEVGKKTFESGEDAIEEKIAEWVRTMKLVQAKTEEYDSQKGVRQPIPAENRIPALLEKAKEVADLKQETAELQKKVDRYAMLPPDEKKVRKEIEKLKRELEYVRKERDQLWERATKG